MLLQELYTAIATDFPVDNTDLGNESARTSDLFIKYIRLYSDENLRLSKLANSRKNIVAEKRQYYSGNASPEVYKEKPFEQRIKTENVLQKYIEEDADIIAYDENIIVQKQKVEILQECLKEIRSRGYAIKAAIEYLKFINGA